MKPKIEVYKDETTGCLVVDGKKYIPVKVTSKKIDNLKHAEKTIFKELDEKKHLEYVNYIAKKLKQNTTAEELLINVLKQFNPRELAYFCNQLKKGEKPKKRHGCFGFTIGSRYLQLVD